MIRLRDKIGVVLWLVGVIGMLSSVIYCLFTVFPTPFTWFLLSFMLWFFAAILLKSK